MGTRDTLSVQGIGHKEENGKKSAQGMPRSELTLGVPFSIHLGHAATATTFASGFTSRDWVAMCTSQRWSTASFARDHPYKEP